MSGPLTEATLLREVARVQHDKTIQAVRDLVESIKTTQPSKRDSYYSDERTAKAFRADLLAGLQRMRDEAAQ
jgi:hypothetical protein